MKSHNKFVNFKSLEINYDDVNDFKEYTCGNKIIDVYVTVNKKAAYIDGNEFLEDEGELLLSGNQHYIWRKVNGGMEMMIIGTRNE